MKTKIIIAVLAVAAVALLIALFAIKKQGEDQHATDLSSISDFSNQVVNANLKITELNQVNLSYSNNLALSQQQAVELSNDLAEATATIASGKATLASAQLEITNLNSRLSDLELQNKVLDQHASELTNIIAQLNQSIDETRAKLAQSENNSAYLQQELQKQMAQKAEIEHKFNDLDELRQQVKKIKTDMYVARRTQLMKNDTSNLRGAQLLMQPRQASDSAAPASGMNSLNVEVGSDGSVRVIPPLGAATNSAAH
jgi:chromosome segregation ATPase